MPLASFWLMSTVYRFGSSQLHAFRPESPERVTVLVVVVADDMENVVEPEAITLSSLSSRVTSTVFVAEPPSRLSMVRATLMLPAVAAVFDAENVITWSLTKVFGVATRYTSRCIPDRCHMSCPSKNEPSHQR